MDLLQQYARNQSESTFAVLGAGGLDGGVTVVTATTASKMQFLCRLLILL